MNFFHKTAFLAVAISGIAMAGNIMPRQNGPAGNAQRVSAETREIANMRADFSVLQEENLKLSMRMEALESQNAAMEAKIQELLGLINALNEQIAAVENGTRDQLAGIRQSVESERLQRQSDMKTMADNVAKQISKTPATTADASNIAGKYSSYVELTVASGDTLSSIAKAAKVPWQDIMAYNGLTSENIRVGQKLKIPMK